MPTKTLLVVEDEALIALLLEDLLDDLGYRVGALAETVAAAMAALDGDSFDAALLDINVADEKVWPVADRLIEAGVPVLFSSGAGDHDRPDAYAACASVRKPYTRASLEAALAALFAADPE